MNNLVKNPINGGTPAIESNKTVNSRVMNGFKPMFIKCCKDFISVKIKLNINQNNIISDVL